MFSVVVTDSRFSSYDIEKEVFANIAAELVVFKNSLDEGWAEAVQQADALLVNQTQITKEIIDSLENCKVISRYGIGYDNVDVSAASSKGIPVCNVPDYCVDETAEHALALMFSCLRRVTTIDSLVRSGGWNSNTELEVLKLRGKTLGIIGLGTIGREFARRCGSLGFSRILYTNQSGSQPEDIPQSAELTSLDTLLQSADIISVHLPLTEETKGLLGKKEIDSMKPNAILINTARGGIVDENALGSALADRRIFAAGLDVYADEPISPDSPLLALHNVVLTDHVAYYSEESLRELKSQTAKNAAAVLSGKAPVNKVNEF